MDNSNTKEPNPSQMPDAGKHGEMVNHNRLLVYIMIGIVLGIAVGGWFPEWGVAFGIVGDIFLNLLMMLVVPLVIFSMIVGITSLGNIRNLGAIGWRTIVYYLATTSIAVLIGIIAVNLVKPGIGVSPGETHEQATYSIDPEDHHRLILSDETWERVNYSSNYMVILLDQQVFGSIDNIQDRSVVTVKFWEKLDDENVYYVTADDGTRIPFYQRGREFVASEPELKPIGQGVEIGLAVASEIQGRERSSLGATLKDLLVGDARGAKQGMIPRNIFKAMAEMDILPLIFFALIFGAALSIIGPKADSTIAVFNTINDVIMHIVNWVMYLAPIGIFGLIADRIGESGGFSAFLPELFALGKYSLTVIGGLFFHGLVVLPLLLWVFSRYRPWPYAVGVGAAILNAFSTASSSATLPLTMQGVEEENGVSKRTAGFVLPLGATINMDGTALYESVGAIFIAQVYGIPLGPAEQGIIFLTATLAAIGAAGIPNAGLVTMVIVLRAVGLPIEGVALILTIDWLLDRFRTAINVWGDSVGAGIIDTYERRS